MIDEKYLELRGMIKEKYKIRMTDGKRPDVSITPDSWSDTHPWTHYNGITLEDALDRAINHLKDPSQDYVAVDGHVWPANESSIYEHDFLHHFLSIDTSERRTPE